MKVTRRQVSKAMAAAGLVSVFGPAVAQSPQKLAVRVDFLPWGMHAGLHLGVEKGWFKDAGVDVDLTDGKGSTLVMQQVASGEVDVGWVQLGVMGSARGKGLPLTSIAGFARKGDLGGLVPEESNIRKVKDLEGKKVVYTAATAVGSLVDVFLQAGGTSRDKLELVNVDSSALLSIYMSKGADCTLTTYPFAKPTADRQRPSRGLLLSDVGLNFPSYGLIATEKTVAAKEDVLKRFVPVVVRSWEYIHAGHVDEGVAAIMKHRAGEKLDPEILKGQIVEYKPFFYTERTKDKKYGWQSDDDWKDSLGVLEKAKLVQPGTKTTDYYTNKFVQA